MMHLKRCTVTRGLLFLALLFAGNLALAAQVVATVVHLSGPLLAKKADGTAKILAIKSEVEEGDTLVTEKNTYAQLKYLDNSEMTLKPNTTFVIEKFSFESDKPGGDSASFNLVKGGLRSITGLLGKRSKERFSLKTPTATIGIRGTTFIAEWVEASPEAEAQAVASRLAYALASTASLDPSVLPAQPLMLAQAPSAPRPPGLAPGLYVSVIDGAINLSNRGGTQNFSAGQFGYTASITQPPVIVPRNPGIQFTPPPSFSTSSSTSGSTSATKSGTVDCEVR